MRCRLSHRLLTGPILYGFVWIGLALSSAHCRDARAVESAESVSSAPTGTSSSRTNSSPRNSTGPNAVASVENATYTGLLQGDEIAHGEMHLQVIRRGKGPAWLDWTETSIFINQLRWQNQPLLTGTTFEQRIVVSTEQDNDQLRGVWSANGKRVSQKLVFDLTFPPALNTRLQLKVPEDQVIESSQGVLQKSSASINGFREWTLELGNSKATTLKIAPAQDFQQITLPRYEIESEIRARRDGIFLRSDITIDGLRPLREPLKLTVPVEMEVQSAILFSGSTQVGAALKFQRDPDQPSLMTIPLQNLNVDTRLTLRLRGFQAVNWGTHYLMPQVVLENALEARRVLTLRVEPPLQLQSAEAEGMLQTSLASEFPQGEVWKYEAREPDSKLRVMIDLPRPDVVADVLCLTDVRRSSAWSAAALTLHVENGSRFDTTVQLPEDWKIISVAAGDSESRLASWTVDQRQLNINWQNPMTPTSHRKVWIFAKTSPWSTETPVRLPIPQFRTGSNVSVNFQVLLPTGSELQVLEGEGWRLNENTPIVPEITRLREVSERLADTRPFNCVSLRSTTESRSNRTLVKIVPKSTAPEAGSSGVIPEALPVSRSSTAESGDPDPTETSTPILNLRLNTTAGPSPVHGGVHQAELQFDRPVSAASLQLKLPADCTVSAVEMDGRPVTIFRNGDEIPLPAESATVESLKLTYMTPAHTDWLYRVCAVPLPRTSIPVAGFHWNLDLPGDQRLSSVVIPGVLNHRETQLARQRDVFGPLTRIGAEGMFNPLSVNDWRDLLDGSSPNAEEDTIRRSWSFLAPTVNDSIEFRTWNVAQTRHYSWVAVLFCLMTGTVGRMFGIRWLRNLSLFWLILLCVATLISPPAWSLIFGGMFAGSLLSILVPRRWIQSRDFLARSDHRFRTIAEISTASSVLLIAAGSWAWGQSPPNVPQTSDERPKYLIETARYELLRANPAPQIRAKFTVMTPPDATEVFVRLPLQEVVFPTSAECLVNGQSQTLIPSLTGDAMVVNLTPMLPAESGSPSSDTSEDSNTSTDESPEAELAVPSAGQWVRSEIQLDFSIRPAVLNTPGTGTGMGPGRSEGVPFQAIVPAVLDSTLHIPESLSHIPFRRWGQAISNGSQGKLLQLGAIGFLRSNYDTQESVDALGASAVTLLEVTPLQFRGQTRLIPGPEGWPNQLPVRFPPECVITSISGINVIDSIDGVPTSDSTSFTLRLKTGLPASPVTINFELPANSQENSQLLIPPFPLWNAAHVGHCIGVTGPPTAALGLVRLPDVVPMAAEEWPAEGDSGRGRPNLAVMLNSPQPIQLTWTRLNPVRTASIAEQLVVQRDKLEWSAKVQLSVTSIPTFRHQFRIDPAIRIDSVTAVGNGMGSEKEIRYSRMGDILSVFVPGGQLGERTFTISGQTPISLDAWTALPSLELIDATILNSEVTLSDQTRWNVELESSPGVAIASSPSPSTTLAEPRVLGKFDRDVNPRPARLRVLMPAEATRADAVTLLHINPRNDWEVVTTFHLTAVDAALKKATFRVPPTLTGVRIRPLWYQYTSSNDENGTTITVKIPDRYSSAATITLAAKLQPALRDQLLSGQEADKTRIGLPTIDVLSAQKASQFVLVDPKSTVVPSSTSSLRIDAAAFPAWAPAEWSRGVQDKSLVCYQQIRKDLTLMERSVAELSGKAEARLDETVLWPLENGSVRGLTRLWLTSKEPTKFRVRHGEDIKIEAVNGLIDGPLPMTTTEEGTEIELPEQSTVSGVLIHWSIQSANGNLHQLQYDGENQPRRLLAVVLPDQWVVTSSNTRQVGPLEIWLDRWESLLLSLRDVSGPIAVDSILLNNVRMCQQASLAGVEAGALASRPDLREKFARLTETWKRLQNELVVSASIDSQAPNHFTMAFTDLLRQPEEGVNVSWLIPDQQIWTGQAIYRPTEQIPWSMIISVTIAAILVMLALRFSSSVSSLRERFARHPEWGCMALGLVWWIWLSPSFFGLTLIILTWIWMTGQWIGPRMFKRLRTGLSRTSVAS